MIHTILGLSVAFISLAFFREQLSRNDEFTQVGNALLIGIIVFFVSSASEIIYKNATHWQDPAIKQRIEFTESIRAEEANKYEMWILDGMPIRLNGNGYMCRGIK